MLSLASGARDDAAPRDITWLLVSPNNRPLGRGGTVFTTSQACREAVLALRRNHRRARGSSAVTDPTGQWSWRVDVDGSTVAISNRTYLRHRECAYNLDRFLQAVPVAVLMDEVRVVGGRRGR